MNGSAWSWLLVLPAALLAAAALIHLRTRRLIGLPRAALDRWRQTPLWGKILVCLLFAQFSHEGVTKLLRNPPPQSPPPIVQMVTEEEIAQGCRLESVTTNAAVSYSMPTNGVAYEPWTLRGGRETHFPLDLGDFAFPYGTGEVHRLDVLSGGMVESFPRPSYMSICAAREWASLIPGESRFWWADAEDAARPESEPYRVKVLTWENVYAGRDRTGQYSAQIVLHEDGDFITRSNNVERVYRRICPFDWDGDGLENTVDPEPLVAGPDAHGTNAEWYNVVCSNVLAAAATSAALPPELTWLEGVNSNAYYFVDVVAERGPAPIYFTGDRESRLGNPIVVARAGETNHVPLLIGINYAVTSTAPFSVALPDEGFATITTNSVSNYEVRWPLDFAFTESIAGSCRVYTATVEPYDPGGAFTSEPPLRGAPCGCASYSGNAIVFDCSPTCGCGGVCPKGILYYLLGGATFAATGGVCRCGFEDPLPPEPISYDPTSAPSLSIAFSKPAVIFEEAYLDSEHGARPKRSTRVQLTVSAYGGAHGGSLALSSQNLGKLAAVGGGAISLSAVTSIAPQETFFSTCVYEAAAASGSADDIKVSGMFTENDTGSMSGSEGSLTAVKLDFTPNYEIDGYPHRHRVGVRETAECSWVPTDVAVICEAGTGGRSNLIDGEWHYTAPLMAGASPYLTAVCQGVRYQLALDIVEPQAVVARSAVAFDYDVPTNVAGGAGMDLELVILPTNVSFMGIAVQEVPSDYRDPQGYFANSYFDFAWSHTTNRGAGVWHDIHARNYFMNDYAEMGDRLPCMTSAGEIADDGAHVWIAGTMNWFIPVGWNENGSDETDTPVKQFCAYWQRFRMASDGTLEVEKLDNVVQRKTNTVVRLNGKIVPLRPR